MKDAFSTYHPVILFAFFGSVLVITMFLMQPVFLVITFAGSCAYSIRLNGKKAIKFNLIGMLPLLAIMAVLNPAFNHQGVTILLYVNDNPITLEAILYGVAAATMFVSVIMWFSCYNAVMTSDKFIYLFGRLIPALSLVFSMVLRFVPHFKAQIKLISNAQKCIGRDVSNGNVWQRARNGLKILSIMITWVLENTIETADSMKSRGYGLRGRTSFSIFRFDARDKSILLLMLGLIAIIAVGVFLNIIFITYYPAVRTNETTPASVFVYVAYGLLCVLPLIIDIAEDFKWRYLKSEI